MTLRELRAWVGGTDDPTRDWGGGSYAAASLDILSHGNQYA